MRALILLLASLALPCAAANVTCTQTGQSAILCDQAQTSQAPTTVIGSLPTCNSAARGTSYIVTDALVPAALATVAAGGSVVVRVTCDGAGNWKVM